MTASESASEGPVRIILVGITIGLFFAAVTVKASLNALSGDARRPAVVIGETGRIERADIVDRNGELLASSIAVYAVYADPRAIWDADEVARKLADILPDLDMAETARRISDKSRQVVYIRRGLSPRERRAIFELGLEGVGFEEERARIYPRGTLAGHVLGYANLDGSGLAGIEYSMDERLSEGGEPLRLTLDSAVQFAVEVELAAAAEAYSMTSGAGIVVDARTGDILALASWPAIDPNQIPHIPDEDPVRINRAVGAVYELGSVYKPFTIAAGIETGELSGSDRFDLAAPMEIAGIPVKDTHPGPKSASATDIIVESSNKGTVQVALRVGARRMEDFYRKSGLLERVDVSLPSSEAPLLPENWGDLSLSRASYGHGLSITPLAFAGAFTAFANGGERVELRLIASKETPGRQRVMSAPTAAIVTAMMRENVLRGTGTRAEVSGYRVAGKTGTAEKPIPGGYDYDANVASFAAVFPADDPKFVVFIVLDEPQTFEGGGRTAAWNAAPTVGRIIERIAPGLGVLPEFDVPEPDPVSYRGGLRRQVPERERAL